MFKKTHKLLFLLVFLCSFQVFSADIDIFDIKGQPGKCRMVVEHGGHAIEWVGKCSRLDTEGYQFVLTYLEGKNEENSSNKRDRSASKN